MIFAAFISLDRFPRQLPFRFSSQVNFRIRKCNPIFKEKGNFWQCSKPCLIWKNPHTGRTPFFTMGIFPPSILGSSGNLGPRIMTEKSWYCPMPIFCCWIISCRIPKRQWFFAMGWRAIPEKITTTYAPIIFLKKTIPCLRGIIAVVAARWIYCPNCTITPLWKIWNM